MACGCEQQKPIVSSVSEKPIQKNIDDTRKQALNQDKKNRKLFL